MTPGQMNTTETRQEGDRQVEIHRRTTSRRVNNT